MERRAIKVRGIVQGVGFRPFVYTQAGRYALRGFVRNARGQVEIEVEGETGAIEAFTRSMTDAAPPLSRIDDVSTRRLPIRHERGFRILTSAPDGAADVFISPDIATCAACLDELLDAHDRRYRYPFLNCTNCGPRLTIVTAAPYDRRHTTMSRFPMCAACRAEYEDPTDRRFHAQPTACPRCGPRLALLDGAGSTIPSPDPLTEFARGLRRGAIGAVKGLGGFHLACDARDETAVRRLRGRKHREEKPFAVMVRGIDAAERLCVVSDAEHALLESRRRPIVLLRRRGSAGVAAEVAPRNPFLGVMLPYTPLHALLMHAMEAVPLVMTSGNRSDEPIACDRADAVERLRGIADLFLVDDRPIHVRCDDSVTRVAGGREQLIRRSRGYAPEPVDLADACPRPMLAVGGDQKNTFALGRERHAFPSHHAGDLDHYAAYAAFERDIGLYERLFSIEPELVVHDLHPDYASTRYARRRAAEQGLPTVAVQHHHAHMASCIAEHRLRERVIGVTFDGTGLGGDGTIWGGEFLVGDAREVRRAAHLRPVRMPGGDRAIREPWRMALAHARDADVLDWEPAAASPLEVRTVRAMLERGLNAPYTSSAGRLFDAVAALCGVREVARHEGQAAVELEWLAMQAGAGDPYPHQFECGFESGRGRDGAADATTAPPLVIDTRPVIDAVARDHAGGVPAPVIARRFHSTVASLIDETCRRLRDACGLDRVTLSGGVFLNALLSEEAHDRLVGSGFTVYRQHLVPPSDGGLSLGQLAVAAARDGSS